MEEFENDINGSDFYGGSYTEDDVYDPLLLDDDLDIGDDEMEGMHIADEDDEEDPDDKFH